MTLFGGKIRSRAGGCAKIGEQKAAAMCFFGDKPFGQPENRMTGAFQSKFSFEIVANCHWIFGPNEAPYPAATHGLERDSDGRAETETLAQSWLF